MISLLAIATTDGATVCDHLAHSAAFIVMQVEDGTVVSRAVRDREHGVCGNHKSFVELLEGCSAVICGGIGPGALDSLAAHGIQSVVTAERPTIDEAAARYLSGTLTTTAERICLCH
jgi:predicted Fe-Mo cluster-binding NifX family protein